jgi:hypothetical protein
MSNGAWNTVKERKQFHQLVELCKEEIMDRDPTDDPNYDDGDDLDDFLELTFIYGQAIGRTLQSDIDLTVGHLRVEDLDKVQAVRDFWFCRPNLSVLMEQLRKPLAKYLQFIGETDFVKCRN